MAAAVAAADAALSRRRVGGGRVLRLAAVLAVVRGGGLVARGGHEGEDHVQGGRAEEGEAVDVAKVDLSGEEQEEAEEEEEEHGAKEVRVVHDVLIDVSEGVEYRECL